MPPKSPELNPVENIWQFMRDNWLSNRVFKSYDDILAYEEGQGEQLVMVTIGAPTVISVSKA